MGCSILNDVGAVRDRNHDRYEAKIAGELSLALVCGRQLGPRGEPCSEIARNNAIPLHYHVRNFKREMLAISEYLNYADVSYY